MSMVEFELSSISFVERFAATVKYMEEELEKNGDQMPLKTQAHEINQCIHTLWEITNPQDQSTAPVAVIIPAPKTKEVSKVVPTQPIKMAENKGPKKNAEVNGKKVVEAQKCRTSVEIEGPSPPIKVEVKDPSSGSKSSGSTGMWMMTRSKSAAAEKVMKKESTGKQSAKRVKYIEITHGYRRENLRRNLWYCKCSKRFSGIKDFQDHVSFENTAENFHCDDCKCRFF